MHCNMPACDLLHLIQIKPAVNAALVFSMYFLQCQRHAGAEKSIRLTAFFAYIVGNGKQILRYSCENCGSGR